MNIFISFLALNLIIGVGVTKPIEPVSITTLIKENMDEFNLPQFNQGKRETNFKSVSNTFDVLNERGALIGELMIFDDNDGYLFVGEGNYVKDHNYTKGFDVNICGSNVEYLIFDGNNYFDNNKNLVHMKTRQLSGNGIYDIFHWHADPSFMGEKDREILTELSPEYNTLAKTINTTFFGNKIMWSHEQEGNDCAQVALSNLLWSYKLNNAVTLPNYCNTYDYLLEAVTDFVPLDVGPGNATSIFVIENINNIFTGTNFEINEVDVTNGISDTLQYGPLIGFYTDNILQKGHFALVTGKGRSVYKKILGISLYTSWDIVNTWYEYGEEQEGYLKHKYWVDNQYISYGWQLQYDSTGNIVPLING